MPPRALKVGRVTVDPRNVDTYVEAVHALATLARERGLNIWVFRHSREPGSFFEFIEAASANLIQEPWTRQEATVVRRLQTIGTYAPESSDVWQEVPPPVRA